MLEFRRTKLLNKDKKGDFFVIRISDNQLDRSPSCCGELDMPDWYLCDRDCTTCNTSCCFGAKGGGEDCCGPCEERGGGGPGVTYLGGPGCGGGPPNCCLNNTCPDCFVCPNKFCDPTCCRRDEDPSKPNRCCDDAPCKTAGLLVNYRKPRGDWKCHCPSPFHGDLCQHSMSFVWNYRTFATVSYLLTHKCYCNKIKFDLFHCFLQVNFNLYSIFIALNRIWKVVSTWRNANASEKWYHGNAANARV